MTAYATPLFFASYQPLFQPVSSLENHRTPKAASSKLLTPLSAKYR
jgi:hypothetical protein